MSRSLTDRVDTYHVLPPVFTYSLLPSPHPPTPLSIQYENPISFTLQLRSFCFAEESKVGRYMRISIDSYASDSPEAITASGPLIID